MTRFLAAIAAVCIIAPALANKPVGAPPSSQAEQAWFTQAFLPGIGGCCSEADGFREGLFYPEEKVNHPHPEGVILQEWKASPDKPGEYDILLVGGEWHHIEKKNVLPPLPANPTGGAVAFIVFNYEWAGQQGSPYGGYTTGQRTGKYAIYVRCFAPGNQF